MELSWKFTVNFVIKNFLLFLQLSRKEKARFCSPVCFGKWKQRKVKVICKTCGKGFSVKPSRIKRGMGKFCSQRCQRVWVKSHMKKKFTTIELKMAKELKKRKIPYLSQIPIPEAGTITDFLLPNKIIIYCDGIYWHNLPGRKAKDLNQEFLLTFNGYKVFRFNDKEIKNSVIKCVDKVEFIYEKIKEKYYEKIKRKVPAV